VRLRIYLGESDRFQGKPAYQAVVHLMRSKGLWGATVTRGIYGYGKESRLHTASVLRLSEDLPIVVEAVDSEKKIRALLPAIEEIVKGGLLTMEPVKVLRRID